VIHGRACAFDFEIENKLIQHVQILIVYIFDSKYKEGHFMTSDEPTSWAAGFSSQSGAACIYTLWHLYWLFGLPSCVFSGYQL